MIEKKNRKGLFSKLDSVMDVSHKKFHQQHTTAKERRAWGRLLINTVSVYAKIMENQEIEDLTADVQKIKEKLGIE